MAFHPQSHISIQTGIAKEPVVHLQWQRLPDQHFNRFHNNQETGTCRLNQTAQNQIQKNGETEYFQNVLLVCAAHGD